MSWLLGHHGTGEEEHTDAKREAVAVTTSTTTTQKSVNPTARLTYRRRDSDEDTSTEDVSHLPRVSAIDISGDTRVNYLQGRGRTGALARETDAEVFDWTLLQQDRHRNAGEQNPHYFLSSADINNIRARPVSGFVNNGNTKSEIKAFNRFPIAYEESQEFANLQSKLDRNL